MQDDHGRQTTEEERLAAALHKAAGSPGRYEYDIKKAPEFYEKLGCGRVRICPTCGGSGAVKEHD